MYWGDDTVECSQCKFLINKSDIWITDYGVLCSHCCDKSRPNNPIKSSEHRHEWKKYTGLTEVYNYCECGEKCPFIDS